ncbi:hypothetical protein F2P56_009650 [Juglans regia]|uniref:TCP domain-containing protein n=1 Tax=Juglans regia TaxID=51240 RepID=A0A833XXR9_JUGRE|nr:hypothetical protein F2P56_009650 [Juglans regia]
MQNLEENSMSCPTLFSLRTHLLDSGPYQVLQPESVKDEEEEKEDHEVQPNENEEEDDDEQDQQAQKRIRGNYQHVQRSPLSNTISSSAMLASRQSATEYGSFVERSMQAGIHEPSSILRSKRMKGEVVKVHSGRFARSRGLKDRHGKVSTSKGTRDRRLRLSASTAIQFYDVQDRLGYDRPSKAIDWLMEKAKAAINALANSPRQNQDASCTINSSQQSDKDLEKRGLNFQHQSELGIMMGSNCGYDRQNQLHMNDIPTNSLSLVSESATTPSSSIQLQDYPPKLKQDVCLSLQSLKKQVLDAPHHASPINFAEEAVNSASFLSDLSPSEIGWFQPHRDWNSDTGHGEEEFVFNSLPQLPQPL